MSLEMKHLEKAKVSSCTFPNTHCLVCLDCYFTILIFQIDSVLWSLPVQMYHVAILHSDLLTRAVIDNGVVVSYGGPNLIQILVPASHRIMCGLCGNISAVATDDKLSLNGSLASNVSVFASSWSLSSPGTNSSEECDLCSECNSSRTDEFASDNICGMPLSSAGSFSGCHSTVNQEPLFPNSVNDLYMSNGNEELFCSRLSVHTFACLEAAAEVGPWRNGRKGEVP